MLRMAEQPIDPTNNTHDDYGNAFCRTTRLVWSYCRFVYVGLFAKSY
jgi:hypothetical protein